MFIPIYIPGWFITLLFFPGIIAHEIGHRFFCDLFKIPVYSINYFRLFSKNAGHVIHKPTNKFKHEFLIAIGPLIINTILAILFLVPMSYFLTLEKITGIKMLYPSSFMIISWSGMAIAISAFPSKTDLADLKEKINDLQLQTGKKHFLLKIFIRFLYLCANINFIAGIIYTGIIIKLLSFCFKTIYT